MVAGAADRVSLGSEKLLRHAIIPFALVCLLSSGMARAQGANSDSTSAGGSLLLQAAVADTLSAAAAESLAAAAADALEPGFDWYTSLAPRAQAGWRANVTSITVSGDLSGNAVWLDGGTTSSTIGRSQTSYRQQDRDQVQSNLNANLVHKLGGKGDLKVDFVGRRTEDENRLTNGDSIILEQNSERARMEMSGGTSIVEGIRQRWAVKGEYEDSRQINRGTPNNRSLLKGGIASRWVRDTDDWKLVGNVGLLGETGDRVLLGDSASASARTDTLGVLFDVGGGGRFNLHAVAERVRFVEERLELARNSSGQIDTTGTIFRDKVGQERESRDSRRLSLTLDSRPKKYLSLTGRAAHNFTQTQYVFSPQGIVQTGQNDLEGDATFRYAESGSLKTNVKLSDSYNDRRTRTSNAFRGRETRRTTEIAFDLDQLLFASTDLDFGFRQTLAQNINEEVTNKSDRDRLITRVTAEVKSGAIPTLTLNAGATYSTTDEINIDAERVGDNRRDTLLEVRGGYTFDPSGFFQFRQNYRMQIVFVDVFASNDRDQFNKQGQLRNELSYTLAAGPTFRFEYLMDFRENGQRDEANPYRETYVQSLRRFDHQFTARVKVPWKGLNIESWAMRGFLREQRSSVLDEEDRGEFHARIGGKRQFWAKRASLSLDLERILQFGPRVREEAQDYWKADTSIAVAF
jgi:hypothetical protein